MTYILDNADGSTFFTHCADQELVEGIDYITIKKGVSAFPDCPRLLAIRNASITVAWQCPVLRHEQSVRLKTKRAAKETKHSTPEYLVTMTASMKKAYKCPHRRKVLSDRKTAYWVNWRKAKAAALASK